MTISSVNASASVSMFPAGDPPLPLATPDADGVVRSSATQLVIDPAYGDSAKITGAELGEGNDTLYVMHDFAGGKVLLDGGVGINILDLHVELQTKAPGADGSIEIGEHIIAKNFTLINLDDPYVAGGKAIVSLDSEDVLKVFDVVKAFGNSQSAINTGITVLAHGGSVGDAIDILIQNFEKIDAGAFVDQLYLRAAGRVADDSGKAFFVGQIEHGMDRGDVTEGFIGALIAHGEGAHLGETHVFVTVPPFEDPGYYGHSGPSMAPQAVSDLLM